MEPINVIIWICVVVFAVTALLALLDISGIYRLPNPDHSKALFKALLLEIVIIAVGGFGAYITNPTDIDIETIPQKQYQVTGKDIEEKRIDPCSKENPPFWCITGEKNEDK
ncbi:MAG: hypothetical protein ABW124_21945 [Candidatus Thiodiazotropha sp. 6PLUC9]